MMLSLALPLAVSLLEKRVLPCLHESVPFLSFACLFFPAFATAEGTDVQSVVSTLAAR